MNWTWTNLTIEAIAGVLGALAIGAAVKEDSVGPRANAAIGLLAGFLSGYFLQEMAGMVVTGAGAVNPSTAVESAMIQALGGLASSACLALVIGLVYHAATEHRARDKQVQR